MDFQEVFGTVGLDQVSNKCQSFQVTLVGSVSGPVRIPIPGTPPKSPAQPTTGETAGWHSPDSPSFGKWLPLSLAVYSSSDAC